MKQYRVVRDGYLGYEAQFRWVFGKIKFPWIELDSHGNDLIFGVNTHSSLEEAKAFIQQKKLRKQVLHLE